MKKILWSFLIVICGISQLLAESDEIKLKQRMKIIRPNISGWCSEEKMLHLMDLVLEVKPKVCVEIGVFGGATLIPMAASLRYLGEGGVIIGIDPWETSECIKRLDVIEEKEHIDWWSKINMSTIYYGFLENLLVYELESSCKIMKKTSERAASEIEAIDILHIDGHRSEELTMLDASLYFPKVCPGGYIWFGDASSFNKQKALDFLLEHCDVVRIIDNGNCVLLKKR